MSGWGQYGDQIKEAVGAMEPGAGDRFPGASLAQQQRRGIRAGGAAVAWAVRIFCAALMLGMAVKLGLVPLVRS
jgi:hypothetical protein